MREIRGKEERYKVVKEWWRREGERGRGWRREERG